MLLKLFRLKLLENVKNVLYYNIMESLIKAQNITVSREKRSILKDVSFEIKAHDFITIIGPNGAGKSMLLKCLMGFFKPNSGKISVKKKSSNWLCSTKVDAKPFYADKRFGVFETWQKNR